MIITNVKFDKLKAEYKNYMIHLPNVHEDFGGPSVYFHQQALMECNKNFLSDRHIEMIYATLSSWGMHRMGETKTKMVSFASFKSSIIEIAEELRELRFLRLEHFDSEPTEIFQKVQSLCFKLQVSVSNSKIVGNSKALAHIIPNLVPPVDRQYSIRFFSERLSNFRDLNEEIRFYSHILQKCYEFIQILKCDSEIIIDDQFNSSFPKVFDNLLMIFIKKNSY